MKEKHKNKIAIKSKFPSAILVLDNKTIFKGIGLGHKGEATGKFVLIPHYWLSGNNI